MYINYGDKDFFEYGVLVKDNYPVFDILYCRPYDDEEDKFMFAECEVDVTDSWINKEEIINYLGMDEESYDSIEFAIGCVEYYGAENFSSPYNGYQFTREEIKEQLKYYLANDDLDIKL